MLREDGLLPCAFVLLAFLAQTCCLYQYILQVIGSVQSVQDALFQITSRLREIIFPPKQHVSHVSSSPYFSAYQELPSPSFRPRHDQTSPGHYHSPAEMPHTYDNRSTGQGQAHLSFPHDMDRTDGANGENERHHYGSDRAYGLSFERPSSPKTWHPQVCPVASWVSQLVFENDH